MSTTRLIRVHATGGPEVLRWEEAPLPAVGPGAGPDPAPLRRSELHRRVPPDRAVSAAPAVHPGRGGGGRGAGGGRGRDLAEAGRPGGLRRRRPGRLQRRAGDAGRPAGDVARVHRRPHGGGDDVEGHDRPDAAAADHPHRARGHHPGAGGGGRRGPDPVPVGPPPGRHGDRHRGQRREGGAGPGARLRSRHRLHPRQVRRPGQGDHRRQGGARGLRQRRQGHVHGIAGLPAGAGPAGAVRERVRAGARVRSAAAGAEGVPVRHPAGAVHVHAHPPVGAGHGRRAVRGGGQRRGEDPGPARFPLAQAAEAHRALEGRQTVGSTVLEV